MTTVVLAIAAASVAGLVARILHTRRDASAAVTAHGEEPMTAHRAEPDVLDAAFSLIHIARRARHEAALAGRAAAEGRPIAERLEDLPSRRWILERIEERIAELRRDLVVGVAEIDEQAHRLSRESQDHRRRLEEAAAHVDGLARLHGGEAAKPRSEQDLTAERRLEQARAALSAVKDQLRESELRHDQLAVGRDRLPAETDAEIAYLREAGDTLVLEHDMAYEEAEHRHPAKQPIATHPGTTPVSAVVPLGVINERAARAGTEAGRAAASRPASEPGEPTGRRWIDQRFAEHLAALHAQAAAERRGVAEELAVIGERLREADRAATRAAQLNAALEARRTGAQRERVPELEREIASAERALHAAQGRRHEHELTHERLEERQRRNDAEHEARAKFLEEAREAARAEHELAFEAAVNTARTDAAGSARHFSAFPEVPLAAWTTTHNGSSRATASTNHH